MKQLTLLFTAILAFGQNFAQDKPRRFTKPATICPVNYGTISTNGITNATQATIDIQVTATTLAAGQKLPANAVSNGGANITITDTTFKYKMISQKGLVFEVIQEIGSFSLIKFWPYPAKKGTISEYAFYNDMTAAAVAAATPVPKRINGIQKIEAAQAGLLRAGSAITTSSLIDPSLDYYLIKTSELASKSEEFEYLTGSWNVGLMYLPVKLRPFATKSGAFDFSSNINLGVSFSTALHQNLNNDMTTNLVGYIGVSSIKIDSLMANDTTFKQAGQETVAFSPAVGLYWQKKAVQLGFVVGMDFVSGKLQKSWIYRGMPWISITAGINIFNLTKNTSSKEGNN